MALGTRFAVVSLDVVVEGAALGMGDRPRPEANFSGSGTLAAGLAGAALLGVAEAALEELAGGEVCWAGLAAPLLFAETWAFR